LISALTDDAWNNGGAGAGLAAKSAGWLAGKELDKAAKLGWIG